MITAATSVEHFPHFSYTRGHKKPGFFEKPGF
jgi:hypothetical protein